MPTSKFTTDPANPANPTNPTMDTNLSERAQDTLNAAKDKVTSTLGAAKEKLADTYGSAKDKVVDTFGTAKDRVTVGGKHAIETVDRTMTAHPLMFAAGGVVVGYILARILHRD